MAAGVTVTVVAWGVLVFSAIDFGRTAREGTGRDWVFLLLATLGAVACMFLAIVLASRMQLMMRSAQRSSTRPLPYELQQEYDDSAYRPSADPSVTSSTTAPSYSASVGSSAEERAPRTVPGKRAARH